MTTFEYGAMSSKYSLQAEDKKTAYCAMLLHFGPSAHLIALYEPQDIVKGDSWLAITGEISKRLDEIFGGEGEFDKYLESHQNEVVEAYKSIKQLV